MFSKNAQEQGTGLRSASSLKPPSSQQPIRPPSSSSRPSGLSLAPFPAPNSAQRAQNGARRKVVLQPGHSPLDWASLTLRTPPHILRGVEPNTPPPQYVRVSRDELKKHKTLEDCWTCINGKVFNITPYVNFHPGGVDEIMKCAGRDGTALFNKYHAWVNADRMLEKCMVGIFHQM